MKSYYKLQIGFNPSISTFNAITDLIGLDSIDKDFSKFKDYIPCTWIYEIIQKQDEVYFDFINNFLDILDDKYDKLSRLRVMKNDISIWMLYEYDQQCNMEFDSNRLKRLGENGITLCISCWEADGGK
ncbi:MAG: hypothetical protein Q8M15_13120 [Bacteroidota bacterium]|nr:hypothetical protein [Bacteroidota bacterium]